MCTVPSKKSETSDKLQTEAVDMDVDSLLCSHQRKLSASQIQGNRLGFSDK